MIKIYAQSYLRIHLHINDETTHSRKNLKLPYFHYYTVTLLYIIKQFRNLDGRDWNLL